MMSRRAKSSGIRLTEYDAALVKGMLARGDRQHDIAAWFGVNGGRIAEVASGAAFHWIAPAKNGLPPPGPYPTVRQAIEARKALDEALSALAVAESKLQPLCRRSA